MAVAAPAAVAGITSTYGPVDMGLTPWGYDRLMREVLLDQDTTIEWCKDVGLLARRMTCHGCGGDMMWEATPAIRMDGYM